MDNENKERFKNFVLFQVWLTDDELGAALLVLVPTLLVLCVLFGLAYYLK